MSKKIKYGNEENNCDLVGSRGIMKSCDIYSKIPTSSIKKIIGYSDFSKIKDGEILYICGEAVEDFIDNYLWKIKSKFILVTGDCDLPIPISINNFSILLNDSRLIHWFSQNLVIKHSKLTPIPIGIDYHTISLNNNHRWGEKMTPVKQETILKEIFNNSKPFFSRKIKAYSNFHFNYIFSKYGYDRKDAINKIPKKLIYYESFEISREKTWRKQIKYAFVVSPHGNGLDCHRTWESLALGCIVIVKTSELDILYEDLPVLIVNEWDDVSEQLLNKTIENFKKRNFNYEKLKLEYWMNTINFFKR